MLGWDVGMYRSRKREKESENTIIIFSISTDFHYNIYRLGQIGIHILTFCGIL